MNVNYCDEHAKLHVRKQSKEDSKFYNDVVRDKKANAFYQSKQWKEIREYIFNRDMATCQVCGNAVDDRKIIDHIHALKISPDEKLNAKNLWCLCQKCHNKKTKIEEKISIQKNGINILKHASRDWWVKVLSERK